MDGKDNKSCYIIINNMNQLKKEYDLINVIRHCQINLKSKDINISQTSENVESKFQSLDESDMDEKKDKNINSQESQLLQNARWHHVIDHFHEKVQTCLKHELKWKGSILKETIDNGSDIIEIDDLFISILYKHYYSPKLHHLNAVL